MAWRGVRQSEIQIADGFHLAALETETPGLPGCPARRVQVSSDSRRVRSPGRLLGIMWVVASSR